MNHVYSGDCFSFFRLRRIFCHAHVASAAALPGTPPLTAEPFATLTKPSGGGPENTQTDCRHNPQSLRATAQTLTATFSLQMNFRTIQGY